MASDVHCIHCKSMSNFIQRIGATTLRTVRRIGDWLNANDLSNHLGGNPTQSSRQGCLKVALATQDGVNVNADFISARSFAFYEVDTERVRFVGLVGYSSECCDTSCRAAALAGCDILLGVWTEFTALPNRSQARLVHLREPLPIETAIGNLRASFVMHGTQQFQLSA